MKVKILYVIPLFLFLGQACQQQRAETQPPQDTAKKDSLAAVEKAAEEERKRPVTAADISLQEEITFDKHHLETTYPYKDTTRSFQIEKIKEKLAFIENFERQSGTYAVLQNYKNLNKEAPTVKNFVRNAYTRVSDTLGTERYQSAPLYSVGETQSPTIYGRDGSLVRLKSSDSSAMVTVEGLSLDGTWDVPKRYVKTIGSSDSIRFDHIAFVDVTNQNICTVVRQGDGWVINSMNPATTGKHQPPYAQETPTGIFVIQERKAKMFFVKDGTKTIQGFAPYASRFTNGAYIHGVPVNNPKGAIVEYSATLGTIPRSHMCVRNASSHAKFIYDWKRSYASLVIVID